MIGRREAQFVEEGDWVEVRVPDGTWRWDEVVSVHPDFSENTMKLTYDSSDPEVYHLTDKVVVSTQRPDGVINRHDTPDWNEYFLAIAKEVSSRAKCRRRQVGAVIVDDTNRIVSTGYNGHPLRGSSSPDCLQGGCPRGLMSFDEVKQYSSYDEGPGICIANHGEANAVLYADSVRGTNIYVTDKPCFNCTKMLLSAGVVKARWPEGHSTVVALFESYLKANQKE